MIALVFRRLLMAIPVLIGITIIVFSMMHLAPGDPAEVILGPNRTRETLEQVRRELGLDRPIYVQYVDWVSHAVIGDLGESIHLNRPVMPEVLGRFWKSLILALVAFTIAVGLGVVAGVLSATHRGSAVDNLITLVTVTGVSVPPFFFGMVLVIVFAVKLSLLPAGGMYDVRGDPSLWELSKHIILPALALAAAPIAVITRMMRASMLELLTQDFVRTARAKGLLERAVIYRHVLRNALIPVVTVFGLQVGYLLSATALIEIVFSWPGLGSLLVQSIITRDLPLAQGAVLLIASLYVLINIASDLVQALLDPRVEFR